MASTTYTDGHLVTHRLANGLTVTMERLPYLRSASAGLWIRAGSAQERPEESGLAHFLEHLFFKGTKSRTVRELMEAVEGRGGQLNAFTSREYTCLYVRTLDKHLHSALEILADIARNSTFADLEKERNVILEEIASVEDMPDEHVHDLLSEFHWPGHPLGRPISGSLDSVSALTRDHVTGFYRRWYQPSEMFFSIAGNFEEQAVLDQIRGEFEAWPMATAPELEAGPGFHAGALHVSRDISQVHLCLAFPGPSRGAEDRFVCDLTSSILGGGSTSRLFERIREDEGLAYAVYTFHSFYRTTGMLGLYAALTPQNFGRARELVFEELRRLRDEGVGDEELEMNREQLKGAMLMGLESTFNRMARMAKNMMFHDRIVPIEEVVARVDAVTPEQVRDFARQKLQADRCALVVLGPDLDTPIDRIDL